MMPPPSPLDDLKNWLLGVPEISGVRSLNRVRAMAEPTPARRASFRAGQSPSATPFLAPGQGVASLVRRDGILRWQLGGIHSRFRPGTTRAGFRSALPEAEIIQQFAFERLEGSKVYAALTDLDRVLTPSARYAADGATAARGLRRWRQGAFEPFGNSAVLKGKRILILIHGTFSNAEALLTDGLHATPEGQKLLVDAERKYDFILAFDHPTLSVSPLLNAFDLAALLRPNPASIDVICHSRGGLVARWFCEAFSDPATAKRVVFVGAPLAGTSLAAAPRLRSTLDHLANVTDAIRGVVGMAATANAFFLAATGLLRVISTVGRIAGESPLFDAAVALVPGLDGQARTGNNEEIRRLRMNTGSSKFDSGAIQYFAIQANFESRQIGWNFLRLFSKPLQRLADSGADLIFEGNNDLVVDTASMSSVADTFQIRVAHDFGTTDQVHHLNYFHQPETVAVVRASFQIP